MSDEIGVDKDTDNLSANTGGIEGEGVAGLTKIDIFICKVVSKLEEDVNRNCIGGDDGTEVESTPSVICDEVANNEIPCVGIASVEVAMAIAKKFVDDVDEPLHAILSLSDVEYFALVKVPLGNNCKREGAKRGGNLKSDPRFYSSPAVSGRLHDKTQSVERISSVKGDVRRSFLVNVPCSPCTDNDLAPQVRGVVVTITQHPTCGNINDRSGPDYDDVSHLSNCDRRRTTEASADP